MARRPLLYFALLCLALALPASASASNLHAFGSDAPAPPVTAKQALSRALAVSQGKGVRRGFELTPALRLLSERLPELRGADRRRAQRLFARPTQGEGNAGESEYRTREETPFCSAHFCIHWVAKTADAPPLTDTGGTPGVPDYIETMSAVFEHVYDVENNQMGWHAAKPDYGRGGSDAVDVYVKEVGEDHIFGYSAPDEDQPNITKDPKHLAAYLVLDNNYTNSTFTDRYSDPLLPMEVTAAHEYNHVLQFQYDADQDNWMFESTATWMEDKVYDDINDYVSYLDPWSTEALDIPLTQANDASGEGNLKIYGDAVWNRWIDMHFGQDIVRRAWELSRQTNPKDFAAGAYDAALREQGSSFVQAFSQFAIETSEWRASNGFFEEGNTYPDMQRVTTGSKGDLLTLKPGNGKAITGTIDHTTYALVNVDPGTAQQLDLVGGLSAGTAGAIALVGRTGSDTDGTAEVQTVALPKGGRGTVTLADPGRFQRITAVVVNSDIRQSGFSSAADDWTYSKDGSAITLVLNDHTAPTVKSTSPKGNTRGVARTAKVKVTFSEFVTGISSKTVTLESGSKSVRARVSTATSRGGRTTVTLAPSKPLAARARYTVRLGDLTDAAGNALPGDQHSFRFSTGS
jgi:hypothetical protein